MSRSYDSYNMLAKLLNSGSEEKIEKAYDALMKLTDAEYEAKKEKTRASYKENRDAIARNKAKADKYLNYFMTEGGYASSGMEADAKLRSELGYRSDLASSDISEQNALKELETEKSAARRKAESDMLKAEAEYEKDMKDTLLNAAELELKKEQADRDEYWKSKEYELDKAKYEASLETTEDVSSDLVDGYRAMLYNEKKNAFRNAETLEELESIYGSLTGVNTENATNVFGADLYETLIGEIRPVLEKKRKEEKNKKVVDSLYEQLLEAGDDIAKEYFALLRKAQFAPFPGFTEEQVTEAYTRAMEYAEK